MASLPRPAASYPPQPSAAGRIGVLLVNLGTPDNPQTPAVRRYLREFLSDPRVIDIPAVPRFFLINGVIAPLRAPKSAKIYQKLWTPEGSPLLVHGLKLKALVQQALGEQYLVTFGMRYQSPSIESALAELRQANVDRIVVLPLFPQYASASTGSVHQRVMEALKEWWIVPAVSFVSTFCNDPGFIEALVDLGRRHLDHEPYDHVLFSYHGLPERHILKGSPDGFCRLGACCDAYGPQNRFCYRAQCFETSRQIAAGLGLRPDQYTVAFQSRLGRDPWLKPYSDEVLKQFPAEGRKRVLAFSPAFVADCLETTIEVGDEFKEAFEEAGGEHWQLVEGLNTHPRWVQAVVDIIGREAGGGRQG